MGKSNYLFTLENINISKINEKYFLNTLEETKDKNILDHQTTKLTELNILQGGITNPVSFLDESKRTVVASVSMIDFNTKQCVSLLRYHCFWCRHPFDTIPIGCPIRYVPSQVTKRYFSHISKDTYTIRENITSKTEERILNGKIDNNKELECYDLTTRAYYETDGVFCSFNCCQAYIHEVKYNKLYDKSETLLLKMYNNMIGTKYNELSPAPHWRTLKHYGGHLNILEFRDSFEKIDYEYHGTTCKKIPMASIGHMYEEKIKF